jgi:hypothetical protein
MEIAGRNTGSLKSDSCMSCAIRIRHLDGFTGILPCFSLNIIWEEKKEIIKIHGGVENTIPVPVFWKK